MEKDTLFLIEFLPCLVFQTAMDTLLNKNKIFCPVKSLGDQKCTTVYIKKANGKYQFIRRFFENQTCSLLSGQMTELFSTENL